MSLLNTLPVGWHQQLQNYHEVKLTANINDDCQGSGMDLIKTLADAQINPTDRQVVWLYDTWR